ncbi:hypothetical protein ANO14919_134740 [Xylariales sp. No.14919]|nr:hypothetical protein ANO14919_134740 [Xylariales sp. No.14919]
MSDPTIGPYPTQLGLFPRFFASQPESLLLREKALSLSGDSFEIRNSDGELIFRVTSEVSPLAGRTHISDTDGNLLFTIRKKFIALHSTFYAEDPNGKVIIEVKGKFSSESRGIDGGCFHPGLATNSPFFFMTVGPRKSVCTFRSQLGTEESLVAAGSFSDTRADIMHEATKLPVATIDREELTNMRDILQTYIVTVAPNVDMAIIIAMCMCLDERQG